MTPAATVTSIYPEARHQRLLTEAIASDAARQAASLRRRALAIIREGRLTVTAVTTSSDDPFRPLSAEVLIVSSRDRNKVYAVDLTSDGDYLCSCDRPVCAHIAAARIVTGGTV